MFSAGKILITDRLHSSILAFLLHKPHVYVDQMYGKIRKTTDIAFQSLEMCSNRQEMRYEETRSFEEAILQAGKMLRDQRYFL